MSETIAFQDVFDAVKNLCISRKSNIRACAAYGISCEGWFKVELIEVLAQKYLQAKDIEIKPEWKNVDLAIITPTGEFLLEIKTFPTNYMRAGKPITNFIGGVAKDLIKLSEKRKDAGTGYCIWLAYVIPDPEPNTWPKHLHKIESVAKKTIVFEKLSLWENLNAYLYIMESN